MPIKTLYKYVSNFKEEGMSILLAAIDRMKKKKEDFTCRGLFSHAYLLPHCSSWADTIGRNSGPRRQKAAPGEANARCGGAGAEPENSY